GDNIELISMRDQFCDGTVVGAATVRSVANPTFAIEGNGVICGDDVNVILDLKLGGQGPWIVNYQLGNEAYDLQIESSDYQLEVSEIGTLTFNSIEDANCVSTLSTSLNIENKSLPTALIGDDATLCNDEEATIQISLTGTAPFTFVYTDGENETTVTTEENLYEFTTTEFKTYTLVSLSDANCSGEVDGSATVSDGSDNIQVEIDTDDYACFGDVIDLALLGDTDGLTVKWSTEGKGTLENIDQITTSYTPAANETGVIVFYVELSNNCAIKTISKEVTIIEEIDASFSVSPEKDLFTNTQITFTPTNNNYDEYEWDFGDGSSSSAVISSTEYSEGGYYTVELLVNIAGCEGTGSTELEILSKDELYVPNAFNPTAQNTENQVVKVYGNNVDEYGFSFKIVNRWGKVMYQTNSFDEANRVGWDGVNNNNNEEQELTVFTYILKGRFIEGEPFERTGTVTQVK
ncbi:MAG: gliding motility-associated C-terminal domain-containing protein, partial [Cyclobacteriaceae bacterium]|nr:gliding motility-associated C-terminal domain-containing protein [Cyclobacteriaceae bacterium]